jgi:hypothetical protein
VAHASRRDQIRIVETRDRTDVVPFEGRRRSGSAIITIGNQTQIRKSFSQNALNFVIVPGYAPELAPTIRAKLAAFDDSRTTKCAARHAIGPARCGPTTHRVVPRAC